MDSQEKALQEGAQNEVKAEAAVTPTPAEEVPVEAAPVEEAPVEEPTPVEETPVEPAPVEEDVPEEAEAPAPEHKVYETKAEVLKRIREIAQMLSGNTITEAALQHAEQLLN